jgi:RND superfamily putative drug exporter
MPPGLAAAILIDATVIRGILLPATLALLGDRAWYLPRWLRWLPGGQAAKDRAASPAGGGPARPAVAGAEEPSLDLARS